MWVGGRVRIPLYILSSLDHMMYYNNTCKSHLHVYTYSHTLCTLSCDVIWYVWFPLYHYTHTSNVDGQEKEVRMAWHDILIG